MARKAREPSLDWLFDDTRPGFRHPDWLLATQVEAGLVAAWMLSNERKRKAVGLGGKTARSVDRAAGQRYGFCGRQMRTLRLRYDPLRRTAELFGYHNYQEWKDFVDRTNDDLCGGL